MGWAAAVGAVALMGMAGCTHSGPSGLGTSPAATRHGTSSPSQTPSVDVQDAAKKANEAAAVGAYQHYFEVRQEVEQRPGMSGWEDEVVPLLGGDLLPFMTNFYTQAQEKELRITAPAVLVSTTPVDYIEDPGGTGHEQVLLDACIDATGSITVYPDGSPESTSFRGVVTVTMQHQNDQWAVDESETKVDETC